MPYPMTSLQKFIHGMDISSTCLSLIEKYTKLGERFFESLAGGKHKPSNSELTQEYVSRGKRFISTDASIPGVT